eukprot:3365691-Rhodomonas_salina.1
MCRADDDDDDDDHHHHQLTALWPRLFREKKRARSMLCSRNSAPQGLKLGPRLVPEAGRREITPSNVPRH